MSAILLKSININATSRNSNKGGSVQSEMDENAQIMNLLPAVAEFISRCRGQRVKAN